LKEFADITMSCYEICQEISEKVFPRKVTQALFPKTGSRWNVLKFADARVEAFACPSLWRR
jgi:hypothetical protein